VPSGPGLLYVSGGDKRLQFLLHKATHLELDRSFCRYGHTFECPWILGDSCRPRSGLEDAEIAELQAIVSGQFSDDFIKERLNNTLDNNSLGLRTSRPEMLTGSDRKPLYCNDFYTASTFFYIFFTPPNCGFLNAKRRFFGPCGVIRRSYINEHPML